MRRREHGHSHRNMAPAPGANGQGRTKEEARESLAEAIALVSEDRRADGLRGVPADAEREAISVDVPGAA